MRFPGMDVVVVSSRRRCSRRAESSHVSSCGRADLSGIKFVICRWQRHIMHRSWDLSWAFIGLHGLSCLFWVSWFAGDQHPRAAPSIPSEVKEALSVDPANRSLSWLGIRRPYLVPPRTWTTSPPLNSSHPNSSPESSSPSSPSSLSLHNEKSPVLPVRVACRQSTSHSFL
ncbi:hypothetical protein B0T20DRAFT_101313 [Sordaria brevicollis]|uniref:Uncharacterized protein n=1 Tax=Sordaria brevicollis TaxID=83679 RepID=A0AAE0NW87_SORBR|nr:hypothetical protein B0T20DRAFT_101313 [Sordaria brevicollis]